MRRSSTMRFIALVIGSVLTLAGSAWAAGLVFDGPTPSAHDLPTPIVGPSRPAAPAPTRPATGPRSQELTRPARAAAPAAAPARSAALTAPVTRHGPPPRPSSAVRPSAVRPDQTHTAATSHPVDETPSDGNVLYGASSVHEVITPPVRESEDRERDVQCGSSLSKTKTASPLSSSRD